jgi:hypothetical protein
MVIDNDSLVFANSKGVICAIPLTIHKSHERNNHQHVTPSEFSSKKMTYNYKHHTPNGV